LQDVYLKAFIKNFNKQEQKAKNKKIKNLLKRKYLKENLYICV
jgi:hypothetical protein